MTKSFENTVARFRKCAEMVDELKGYTNTLAAERDKLEDEIIVYLAALRSEAEALAESVED